MRDLVGRGRETGSIREPLCAGDFMSHVSLLHCLWKFMPAMELIRETKRLSEAKNVDAYEKKCRLLCTRIVS